MQLSTWLVYISVIGLLILSPGPSALLCVSDGLNFGNKRAISVILGGACAALVLMTVSAIGLGAILAASATLFLVIKLVGALYLVFLGWSACTDVGVQIEGSSSGSARALNYSPYSRFEKGFMVGISNPKDLLFFIALFPSFMNADLPAFKQYALLACTWFVLDCAIMFMYAALGSKVSPFLAKTQNQILVNRVVGAVFIVLGLALVLSATIR